MRVHFKINKELDKDLIDNFINFKTAGVDFGYGLVKLHPQLAKVRELKGKERKEYISNYVEDIYLKNSEAFEKKKKETENSWARVENDYFSEAKKIFKLKSLPKKYTAFLTIINSYPRFIDKKEFCVGFFTDDKHNIEIACHEIMHFFFYDYYYAHFEKKLTKNQLWDISEIFNPIILNTPNFSRLFAPRKETPYPAHEKAFPIFNVLWNESIDIDDFFVSAIKKIKELKIED